MNPLSTLSILSPEYAENPYLFIDRLDRKSSVVFDPSLNAKIVIGYKTAKHVLAKPDVFTTEPLAQRAEPVMRGKVLAQMTGEEHHLKKSLIVKYLTGKYLREIYTPRFNSIADKLIQSLASQDTVELVSDFGDKYAFQSTFSICGIGDDDFDFYRSGLKEIVKFATGFNVPEAQKEKSIQAAVDLEQRILSLIEEKTQNPSEDLLSYLIHEGKIDPNKKLKNSDLVALMLNILLAASEPVDKIMVNSLYQLYQHPEILKAFIQGELSSNAILQETLRLLPPVHLLPRMTSQAYTTPMGNVFTQGELIFVLIPAANRDPFVFPEAAQFHPTRSNAKSHLAYGSGFHAFIGAQLANQQLNIALEKFKPFLPHFSAPNPPIFSGIYTRGATQYHLNKINP